MKRYCLSRPLRKFCVNPTKKAPYSGASLLITNQLLCH